MKKEYLRPEVEYIEFYSEEAITVGDETWGAEDGSGVTEGSGLGDWID